MHFTQVSGEFSADSLSETGSVAAIEMVSISSVFFEDGLTSQLKGIFPEKRGELKQVGPLPFASDPSSTVPFASAVLTVSSGSSVG